MNKEEFIQTLEQYKALKLHDVIDYDKFYLYSVITNSTAIEGSPDFVIASPKNPHQIV